MARSEELRYRPTCRDCGYQDEAIFTARQMDTCDFRCPKCDSIYFDFPIEPAPHKEGGEQERCPSCKLPADYPRPMKLTQVRDGGFGTGGGNYLPCTDPCHRGAGEDEARGLIEVKRGWKHNWIRLTPAGRSALESDQ